MKKLILSFLFSAASLLVFSQTIFINVSEMKNFIDSGEVEYIEVLKNKELDFEINEVKCSYTIYLDDNILLFANGETNGVRVLKSFTEENGVSEIVFIDDYNSNQYNDELLVKIVIDSINNTLFYTYFNSLTDSTVVYQFTDFDMNRLD
jgi:hypothetical protein